MHLDHSIITGYELAVLHYYIYIYCNIQIWNVENMQSKGSFKYKCKAPAGGSKWVSLMSESLSQTIRSDAHSFNNKAIEVLIYLR